MRRYAVMIIALAAVLFSAGCVQSKYEDGREKQKDKADKMIEKETE